MSSQHKIVITGGPCAGKTASLERVKSALEKEGYHVLIIPEVATELCVSGITPKTCASKLEFQTQVALLQLKKEARALAEGIKYKNSIIIYDRGLNDGKAFLKKEDFQKMLLSIGLSEEEIFKRYDAVFHLTSAANGAEEHYSLSNNEARTETIQEARDIDNKILAAWENHPRHYVIENIRGEDFNKKIDRLITKIIQVFKAL